MRFERKFTREGFGPYEGIEWEPRKSEIRNPDGKYVFHMEGVVVPSFWSQIATDILAQKYLRKAGVLPDKAVAWKAHLLQDQRLPDLKPAAEGCEHDARQVFHRLAFTWKSWGEASGYFDSPADSAAFYEECLYMLAHQVAAPNSPQWFNTGLFSVYAISGPPQGHYFVDPLDGQVRKSASAYERPQPHACFILNVEDDLVNENGIMDLVTREARLFKYGSGTGSNFSKLRAHREPLSGGGLSSGLLSFLKIADRSANAIKSGGTTRRAAKMVILDADHPDIEAFVQWKAEEEYKVACLSAGSSRLRAIAVSIAEAVSDSPLSDEELFDFEVNKLLRQRVELAMSEGIPPTFLFQLLSRFKQGDFSPAQELPSYNTAWEGEAYNTVSGQSSNNSVRVDNAFMQAVLDDTEWHLMARTSDAIIQTVRAKKLWQDIAKAAWRCADPGLQFHGTINEWHTCLADGEIRASNPCSEYMFLDDTACNLASLNLMSFYHPETGFFDDVAYRHAIRIWTTVLEISVVMAQFPSQEIAKRSYEYRTLGLGFANLGSLLMVMGLPYDSDEGRAVSASITAILTGEAYAQSALMAKEWGPFARYEANKTHMLKVMRNHRRAVLGEPDSNYEELTVFPKSIVESKCPANLFLAAKEVWDTAIENGTRYGYRNAQVSAIAPTGTIGMIMDCDTTGIEPDFALIKYKKLAGGGYFKIINRSIPPALGNLGYSPEQIARIEVWALGHQTLKIDPSAGIAISWNSLKEKGFPEDVLERIEGSLALAMSLEGCFVPAALGESCMEALGITHEKWTSSGFGVLEYLGWSKAEIEKADIWICGSLGIEDAPDIAPEHLAIFDTATASGRKAHRSIPWQAHVAMMAAVQPFVSGAISKTINMPNSSSFEDVEGAHLLAWQSMLKSIALYRDGSKLSQPLSSLPSNHDNLAEAILALETSYKKSTKSATTSWEEQQNRELPGIPPESRGVRRSLPTRRNGYTQKAKIGSQSIFLRTGNYDDGSLGEIFLDMHKEGATFRSILNSFAIAVSLGLQYGVPLEEFVDAFTFTRFEPNGMVVGHNAVKMATSVLDFIFRDLGITYLDRLDLAHDTRGLNGDSAKPKSLAAKISPALANVAAAKPGAASRHNQEARPQAGTARQETTKRLVDSDLRTARLKGFEGDPCPNCGHLTLVRNGSCLKCETCGSTTGCS